MQVWIPLDGCSFQTELLYSIIRSMWQVYLSSSMYFVLVLIHRHTTMYAYKILHVYYHRLRRRKWVCTSHAWMHVVQRPSVHKYLGHALFCYYQTRIVMVGCGLERKKSSLATVVQTCMYYVLCLFQRGDRKRLLCRVQSKLPEGILKIIATRGRSF